MSKRARKKLSLHTISSHLQSLDSPNTLLTTIMMMNFDFHVRTSCFVTFFLISLFFMKIEKFLIIFFVSISTLYLFLLMFYTNEGFFYSLHIKYVKKVKFHLKSKSSQLSLDIKKTQKLLFSIFFFVAIELNH